MPKNSEPVSVSVVFGSSAFGRVKFGAVEWIRRGGPMLFAKLPRETTRGASFWSGSRAVAVRGMRLLRFCFGIAKEGASHSTAAS
jgi:hypothetical protein